MNNQEYLSTIAQTPQGSEDSIRGQVLYTWRNYKYEGHQYA